MESPWKVLGIARNSDKDAARKAYAKKLKEIDQDQSPAEFQRLNSAYRQALKIIESQNIGEETLSAQIPNFQPSPNSAQLYQPSDLFSEPQKEKRLSQVDTDASALNALLRQGESTEAAALLKRLLDSESYRSISAKQNLEDAILNLPFEEFQDEKPFLAECILQFYWSPSLSGRTFRDFQINRVLDNYRWPKKKPVPKKTLNAIDDTAFGKFLNTKAGMFSIAASAIILSFVILASIFMLNPKNSNKSLKEIFLGKPTPQVVLKVDYAFPLLDAYQNLDPDSEEMLLSTYQSIANHFSTKSAQEIRDRAAHDALILFGSYLPISDQQLTRSYLRAHVAFMRELFSINPALVNQIHYPTLVGTAHAADIQQVKTREKLIATMKDIISDRPKALKRVVFLRDGAKITDEYRKQFKLRNPKFSQSFERISATRTLEGHRILAEATIAYCDGLQGYSGHEIGEIMFRMFRDP